MRRKQPITASICLLTPAFTGGAEPRECEGIRATSVIHGLRYWFRALAGGLLGWDTRALARLRDEETRLFGGSLLAPLPDEPKSLASRLRISVIPENLPVQAFDNLPPSPSKWALGYLGYSARERQFIEAGGTFTVSILVERTAAADPTQELVRQLLRLWVRYSGLGGRARHGLGSMAEVGDFAESLEAVIAETRTDLQQARDRMRQYLSARGCALRDEPPSAGTPLPAFAVASPEALQVKLMTEKILQDSDEALFHLHEFFRKTRENIGKSRQSNNSGLFHRFLGSPDTIASTAVVKFAGLALPLPFAVTHLNGKTHKPPLKGVVHAVSQDSRLNEARLMTISRRASPVWLRLRRLKNGRLAALALFWNCTYLPEDFTLVLSGTPVGTAKQDRPVNFVQDELAGWWAERSQDKGWKSIVW